MTIEELGKLRAGDHVWWQYPVTETRYKLCTIASIKLEREHQGDTVVTIVTIEGDEFKCDLGELS